MLSIKAIGSSSGEVNYYARGMNEAIYYAGSTGPEATWRFDGAKQLGLSGLVNPEELSYVLRGFSPDGEHKLVQNAGSAKRRSAFDLTWSAPKSVSAAYSQADGKTRQSIQGAFQRAIDASLIAFEQNCAFTRRGKYGVHVEPAKLIGMTVLHDTARGTPGNAPDAQLHCHTVIANAVVREDGTTGAFDARFLFQSKMMLGAMFRTQLSKELETIGLRSYRPQKEHGEGMVSWFELEAVPRSLVEEMSKRRREIDVWLTKRGLTGAKMAEKAALLTRREKKKWSRDALFAAWHEYGKQHGFTNEQLQDYLASVSPIRRNTEHELLCSVTKAIATILETQARFTRTDLLRAAAEEAQCRGIGIEELTLAVDQALQRDLLKLRTEEEEPIYTTREMYFRIEQPMLDAVVQAASQYRYCIEPSIATQVLRNYPTIRNEQAMAVHHVTTGADVACIVGVAGAGKTFALRAANECWRRAGLTVLGTTLAATASEVLADGSGIESVHIHKLLHELERGDRQLPDALVCDESGMIDSRLMKRIVELMAGRKLVLVGDYKQLQAIQAGAAFRGIVERVGCCAINEIIRQRETWARKAVRDFRDGNALDPLMTYLERGLLQVEDNPESAMVRLIDDWAEVAKSDLKETLILAETNFENTLLNRMAQQKRMTAGDLSEQCVTVDATSTDLHIGDRIVFRKNNASLCVSNGSRGTIVGISPHVKSVRVRLDNGFQVKFCVDTYEHVALGYALTAYRAQGVTLESDAFLLVGGPMTDREMAYVANSRSKARTRLYVNRLSGCETIEKLATLMTRSRAKDLAHDYELEVG